MKTQLKPVVAALCLVGVACSARNGAIRDSARSKGEAVVPLASGYARGNGWTLLPNLAGADFFVEDPDGSTRGVAAGLRLRRKVDGSLEQSRDFMPVEGARVLDLPERMGGGYLFLGEQNGETSFWRAESWTSELLPLARVSDRVESIVIGFDRLYLELPLAQRWGAIDVETGSVLDTDPLPAAPWYTSMAFADAWFGGVSSDVLGVLVTFDAGASWQRLPGVDRRATVSADGGHLLIETELERLRLSPDGKLRRQTSLSGQELFQTLTEARFGPAPEGEQPTPAPAGPALRDALLDAVLLGWPTADDNALVVTQGALALVRLQDGAVLRVEPGVTASTEPCPAFPLGDGIGFACHHPIIGTTLLRFEKPFGVSTLRRFAKVRTVRSNGNGALVISGSCDERGSGVGPFYCFLHRSLEFDELRVRGDVGVERLTALDDESIVVLVPPRLGSKGSITRIEGGEQRTVELELPGDERAFLETGLWLDGLVQVSKREVGTWVAGSRTYQGVVIGLDGTVKAYAGVEGSNVSRAVFSGSVAFEATPSGVAWLSKDFGRGWTRLVTPPTFYPLDERTALQTLGPAPRIGCSRVGCVYGPWAHVGFPDGAAEPESDAGSPAKGEEAASPAELVAAELPARVQFNPTAYNEWRPSCHATGRAGAAPAELARRLNQLALDRPRRGLVTGFLPPLLLQNPKESGTSVFRPFAGLDGPSLPRATVRFDEGREGAFSFRAYAWATTASEWASSAVWQVRIRDPFDPDGIWATAPTFVPWPDVNTASELFGNRDGRHAGSDFSLELDPDGEGGILRVGSGMSAELHVVGKGRATQSFGAVQGGRLAGAVKVSGEWYYGQHEGDEYRVHRLGSGGPQLVATLTISNMHRVTLVRSNDGSRLGVLVRTRAGAWYAYPLDEQFTPDWPLLVTRESLNQAPVPCPDGASGWSVVSPVPPSRLDPGQDSTLLSFPDLPAMRASAVHARLLVRDGSICVSELAAELAERTTTSTIPPRSNAIPADSVLLRLREPGLERHLEFRCGW